MNLWCVLVTMVMIMLCWICEGKPASILLEEHFIHPILFSRQTQITQDLGREMKIEKSCICPRFLMPVCGEDGRTYNNHCLAECEDVKVECDGDCPCRSCLCPEIYQPVCGEDGVTYSNKCMAQCANTRVQHEGKCQTETECVCQEIYEPVCGEDGRTYSNSCRAKCANAKVACWDICSECA